MKTNIHLPETFFSFCFCSLFGHLSRIAEVAVGIHPETTPTIMSTRRSIEREMNHREGGMQTYTDIWTLYSWCTEISKRQTM